MEYQAVVIARFVTNQHVQIYCRRSVRIAVAYSARYDIICFRADPGGNGAVGVDYAFLRYPGNGIAYQPFYAALAVDGIDIDRRRQYDGIRIRIIAEHFAVGIARIIKRRNVYLRSRLPVGNVVSRSAVPQPDFARGTSDGQRDRLRSDTARIAEFGSRCARSAVVQRLGRAV